MTAIGWSVRLLLLTQLALVLAKNTTRPSRQSGSSTKLNVAPSPKQMLQEELDKDKRPNLNLKLRISKKKASKMQEWEKDIEKSKKWIVLSTNRNPTTAVKSLLEQKGWQVVVVATKGAPRSWSLKGCIYLTLDRQQDLDFEVGRFLPKDSYTRKVIGYLFALRHGAQIIFDTDDNTEVLKSGQLVSKQLSSAFFLDSGAQVGKNTLVYSPKVGQPKGRQDKIFTRNVNVHFGQPNTWARGYPLQDIAVGVFPNNYTRPGRDVRAYIQVMMANGDPDVDAIFRQTRKPVNKAIDFEFDANAPAVVLPPGVFSPFNSKSTLFHREAFWALGLPPNKNDHVPDVWRSYVAQKLLGDIGGQVAFLPPILYQNSRQRNVEEDYTQQHTVYYKTGALLEYLSRWRSPKGDVIDRLLALVVDLAKEGFYAKSDALFTEAFLSDLTSVGYTPRDTVVKSRQEIHGKSAAFRHRNLQTSFAVPPVSSSICSKILLIVIFSSESQYGGVERQRKLYSKRFTLVFYGPTADSAKGVKAFENPDGVFHHRAIVSAIRENKAKDFDGYLYLSGDALLNYPHVLNVMDPTKIWVVSMKKHEEKGVSIDSPPDENWGHPQFGVQKLRSSFDTIPSEYTDRMKSVFGASKSVVKSKADIGYIPRRFTKQFLELGATFQVTYEIAMPTMLRLLSRDKRDVQPFPHACKYLDGDVKSFSVKPFHTIVRPVKFNGDQAESLDKFQAWAEDRFVAACA